MFRTTKIVTLGALSLVLSFAAETCFAQGTPGNNGTATGNRASTSSPAGTPGVISDTQGRTSAAGNGPSGKTATNSSPANVMAARPFGEVDTTKAGATTASVGTWAHNLTEEQRKEVSERCAVINAEANRTHYKMEDVKLFQNYASAMGSNQTRVQ